MVLVGKKGDKVKATYDTGNGYIDVPQNIVEDARKYAFTFSIGRQFTAMVDYIERKMTSANVRVFTHSINTEVDDFFENFC